MSDDVLRVGDRLRISVELIHLLKTATGWQPVRVSAIERDRDGLVVVHLAREEESGSTDA